MGRKHKYLEFEKVFNLVIEDLKKGIKIYKSLKNNDIDSTTFYRYTTEEHKNKMKEAKKHLEKITE